MIACSEDKLPSIRGTGTTCLKALFSGISSVHTIAARLEMFDRFARGVRLLSSSLRITLIYFGP